MISLDLSKAFDCVPHGLLLAKLKAYGVAETGIALMWNYLTGRSQRVKVGDNVSTLMPAKKGILQGSVLVFVSDLCYFMGGVSINDDELIYDSDKDPVRLGARLQCHFLKSDRWFGVNGMIHVSNSDKYQAMLFGNTNHAFSFQSAALKFL